MKRKVCLETSTPNVYGEVHAEPAMVTRREIIRHAPRGPNPAQLAPRPEQTV